MKVTSLVYTNYQPKQRHYSIFQPSSSSSTLSNPSKDTSCVIRRLTTKYLPTFVGWICLETVASVARKPGSQLLLYASLFRYMSVVYQQGGGSATTVVPGYKCVQLMSGSIVAVLGRAGPAVELWKICKLKTGFANSRGEGGAANLLLRKTFYRSHRAQQIALLA